MESKRTTDTGQGERWNGPTGNAWVDAQALVDEMYRPLEELVVQAVRGQVLDVGCGTGGTTVAAARRLGDQGRCIGIDISDPMIAAARARAEQEGVPASFVRANAQDHAFEPATFDTIISRFGVMFFDDSIRAFANLRKAATDAAALRFVAWRDVEENPFMTTAERAAAPLLPNLPARQPDAPGQFAFADSQRVQDILRQSGWTGIDIRPVEVTCVLPESELVWYFTHLGLVGTVLPDVDDQTRARVIETVRPAFDQFVHGDEVRFTAACWLVEARG